MRSSSLLTLSLPLAFLTACGPNIKALRALSAGSIGCPETEIAISNPTPNSFNTRSWQADCRDHAFICGVAGFETVNCTPMLPPIAQPAAPLVVAAAPVAAAPPPLPEVAACGEAADYDKRAAAASGPAQEQLLKIADHKHRDCDAARASPPAPPPPPTAPPAP